MKLMITFLWNNTYMSHCVYLNFNIRCSPFIHKTESCIVSNRELFTTNHNKLWY